MKAVKLEEGVWIAKVSGNRNVTVWMDELGIHIQERDLKIKRKNEFISYDDLVAKVEKQSILPLS